MFSPQNVSKRLRHERHGVRYTASSSIMSPQTRVESTITIPICRRRPHLTQQASGRTLPWLLCLLLWAALAIEGSSSYRSSTKTCHAQCTAATAAFHCSRTTASPTRPALPAVVRTFVTTATALHTVAHGAAAAPLHAISSTDTTRQQPALRSSISGSSVPSGSLKSRRVLAESMGLWCETQVQGLTERLTGSTVRTSLSQRYFGNQPFAMTYTDPKRVHNTLFRLSDDDLGEAENEIMDAAPTTSTLRSSTAVPRQDSPTNTTTSNSSGENRSWFRRVRRRDDKQSNADRLIDDQRQVWEALNSLEKDSTYHGYYSTVH
jgi:hypothetical protein